MGMFMQEIFMRENFMAMALISGKMEVSMKANLQKEKDQAKVFGNHVMATNFRASI